MPHPDKEDQNTTLAAVKQTLPKQGRGGPTADELEAATLNPQPLQSVPTNQHSLPDELYVEIIRNVINPLDLAGTLTDLDSLRRTGRVLNRIISVEINDVRREVEANKGALDDIPIGNHRLNPKALRLLSLTTESSFLSLKSAAERSNIINNILAYHDFPRDAVNNLVKNIEYANSEDRTRIVDYVCNHSDNDNEYYRRMLLDIIDKAELLEPSQLGRLVELSGVRRVEESVENQRARLDYWGGKMKLLSEKDQSKVLAIIKSDDEGKGRSIAYFAEHLNNLTQGNRSDVVREILELPAETQCRWEALSHLAEHLPSISFAEQRIVADRIINDFRGGILEAVDDDQPWYSKQDFCKVEAIYQLSKHPLNQEQQGIVDGFVYEMITGDRQAEKAMMITHLPVEERENFVADALDKDIDGVIYGLTARVQELKDMERAKYIAYINEYLDEDNNIEVWEAVDYNIYNNLEVFTPDERSILVDRRLEYARWWEDVSSAGPAIADIARNGKYLRLSDVVATIEAARRIVDHNIDHMPIDDESDASIMSIASSAARCLANWGGEAIARSWGTRAITPAPNSRASSANDHDIMDEASDGEGHQTPQRAKRYGRSASEAISISDDDVMAESSTNTFRPCKRTLDAINADDASSIAETTSANSPHGPSEKRLRLIDGRDDNRSGGRGL